MTGLLERLRATLVANVDEHIASLKAGAKPNKGRLRNPDGPEAAAHIDHQAATIARLTSENEQAWRERNVAYAKVKAWEAVVYVEGLSLRAVSVDEWGPGEGEQTTVPDVTPKRLVDLLDELAKFRAALKED